MMDKNREAFEAAWIKEHGNPLSSFESMWCEDGGYNDEIIDGQWWAWNASRQDIEVELPEEHHSDSWLGNGCCDDHANTKIAECRKALTSLGIRVKGNEE